MLILSGQNARKKFIHHPLAFPTNVQKNLHQHNGSMQIFLNISRDFSLFYNDSAARLPLPPPKKVDGCIS